MATALTESVGSPSAIALDAAGPGDSKMPPNGQDSTGAPPSPEGGECDNDAPPAEASHPPTDDPANQSMGSAEQPPGGDPEGTNGHSSSLPNAPSHRPTAGAKSPRREHDHLRTAASLGEAPIPEQDKGGARAPKVKSTTFNVDGTKVARNRAHGAYNDGESAEGEATTGGERGEKPEANSLPPARQSGEHARRAEAPGSWEGHGIQFLANQAGEDRDFTQRVAMNGTILDRIAAVPHRDARGLESLILGLKGDGGIAGPPGGGDGWVPVGVTAQSGHPSHPGHPIGPSSAAMNGVRPSMAPPMFPDRPGPWAPPEDEPSKKKGKKRGREKGAGGHAADGGKPKKKKSRKGQKGPDSPGTKPPPQWLPSPLRISAPRPGAITLPDPAPRFKTHEIITDERPRRMGNPLLRMPQWPSAPGTPGTARPEAGEVPQGAELWHLAELHYALPDTHPIGYLARVLGFDVPSEGVGQAFGAPFDPRALERMTGGIGESAEATVGSFADRCWTSRDDAGGRGDDRHVTYGDPQWARILSSYRGHRAEDFKDAGKGYGDVLSAPCLAYAKERGVLPQEGGVTFRFAAAEDEARLAALAEACPWKSNAAHDLAASLRAQGHFCIVAEAAAQKEGCRGPPVAYLQYRFCWYKVEDKKRAAGASTDKVSELVVHIDNLVCLADAGDKTRECVQVLLASLALVHAARVDVWYGMMDAPLEIAPAMTTYFRMSDVRRGATGDGAEGATVPLVFDIKKCHYRYSILLLEETLKSDRRGAIAATGAERMLVHLHADTAPTAHLDAATRTPPGPGVFANANAASSQTKAAHVRLIRKAGDEAELFSVSMAAPGEGEEATEVANPIDLSSVDPSAHWNVMRSFPVGADGEGGGTAGDARGDNLFLAELRKKQSKLQELESSIETTSRDILSKAYDEQTAFATGSHRADLEADNKKLAEYKAVITRLHEAELAWQAQLDQDMDAECDVCYDGEVTPDNQILFCDACNVAVHQRCYGVAKIPTGNFFCHACTHFELDKEYQANRRREGPPTKITRHPILCELCPRRQGAFVQVQTLQPTKKAKWVHVGCAKWQGMNYVDVELKDKIEDLTQLKQYFKVQGLTCHLCKSGIGALHQCREKGCEKWFHLTCARSLGKCSVQHGENCEGYYNAADLDNPPWTLACPKHSDVDPETTKERNLLSAEQLVALAETYPPEPLPPKPFNKMTAPERKEYWADKDNLEKFLKKVTTSVHGAKCAVCDVLADPAIDKRCNKCGVFSHADCADPGRGDGATCLVCRFVDEQANAKDYEEPRCHMCTHPNESGGPLVRTFAKPMTMKNWKRHSPAFNASTFGPNKFCHALCGLWNNVCLSPSIDDNGDIVINCSDSTMANGKDHVSHQFRCTLCGLYDGAKVDCCIQGCVAPGGTRKCAKFHVTCAKQAGLEVSIDEDGGFWLKCWNHLDCGHVFRARLEDMRELELDRNNKKKFQASVPMSWTHASSLFHTAVGILRTLGWAWRWADWWVAGTDFGEHGGDNWEPLLEPGQREEDMTEAELKIVKSTPESRCKDARRCRLAAFGAALRNRDYDKDDGDDQEPLERALTAILSTRSLVGPLSRQQIDFFVTWLSLAYRSRSPALGFGADKAPVATDCFCVHQDDGSPKYELGSRPLPGKTPPEQGSFEPPVEEVDDFLKEPVSGSPVKKMRRRGGTTGSEVQGTWRTLSTQLNVDAVDTPAAEEGAS